MFWRNKSLFFILNITLQSDLEPGVYLVGVITLVLKELCTFYIRDKYMK